MSRSKKPFISRVGLVKNLQGHLLQGRWAAMIGGPMIGKTTLATQLVNRINTEKDHRPQAKAIFLSLAKTKDLSEWVTELQSLFKKVPPEQSSCKVIVVMDNCDHILKRSKKLAAEIINFALDFKKCRTSLYAICWVGGPAWGDWISKNTDLFKMPIRAYPLSVIPVREARAIILKQLGPAEVERVWQLTGGHPFLLEKHIEGIEGTSETCSRIEAFVKRLQQEMKPEEEIILSQLDPEGGWMPLDALRGVKEIRPEKWHLNRLCMIGLIVRTLDQGSAVVRRTILAGGNRTDFSQKISGSKG